MSKDRKSPKFRKGGQIRSRNLQRKRLVLKMFHTGVDDLLTHLAASDPVNIDVISDHVRDVHQVIKQNFPRHSNQQAV